ncbi:MAG: hypothetical protein KGQ59_05560, partial [Bdellovibrionales bacterium]|nr:hypothetical protein [Bdellovibrionales bacterium]
MWSSDEGEIILKFSGAAIFFGGAFVYSGLKRYFRARQSVDQSTSKIATAAQGFVELQGHAWPNSNKVLDGLNGQRCVYLHLKLEKQVNRGKSRKWEIVGQFEQPDRFYLVDGTGCVLVRAKDFEKEFRSETSSWSSLSLDARKRVLSLLNFTEKDGSGFWSFTGFSSTPGLRLGLFGPSYRVTQQYLVLGNPVLAHGRLTLKSESSNSVYDKAMGRFFVELKNQGKLRKNFDLNLDGEVSEV